MINYLKSNNFFVLFFLFCFNHTFAQLLPDTLHYLHNSNVAGTQWEFTAVQITDIHLGETSANGDYGTTGWNDTIDPGTTCPATQALSNVVSWINNNIINEKIELVLVTGDFSDRGEKSGFIMAKYILDSLNVPYIVTNGNHDMWPRISGDEAPRPFGDSIFSDVFNTHFLQLSQQLSNWNNGTRLNRIFNPLNNIYSQFQNFSFNKGSYHFIVSDFATRDKKPIGVGTMTDAALFNFPEGTYPWLTSALAQAQTTISDGVILVQHFPLDNEAFSSTYSFSSQEYDSIVDIIEPYAAQFGLCISGHRHRNKTYNIKRSAFSPILGVGIETDANSKYPNGMIRLIKFWDYPSANIKEIDHIEVFLYPNPITNKTKLIIDNRISLKELSIEIHNIHGQLIKIYHNIDSHNLDIERGQLAQGVYFINIKNNLFSETVKMIISD